MSLTINITTYEGIVMAADSRQSYINNRGAARIGGDNVKKLFEFNKRIAISAAGVAFLEEKGSFKNIGNFIVDMINDISNNKALVKNKKIDLENLSVSDVANIISYRFNKLQDWEKLLYSKKEKFINDLKKNNFHIISENYDNFRWQISYENNEGSQIKIISTDYIEFIISGYNKDNSYEGYRVYVPGKIFKCIDSKELKNNCGSLWAGQGDVVSRIILGWDPRIRDLEIIKDIFKTTKEDDFYIALNKLGYIMNWGTMSLQDAIDLSILLIKTTSSIQRFSDGIVDNPGDIPGVGGSIDVLIIQPNSGIKWISKKEFKIID